MILTHLQEWLLDQDTDRCILVEVKAFDGQEETVVYLSTRAYASGAGVVPENTAYLPCIVEVAPLNESLGLDGKATLSLGEITLSNDEGDLDEWLGWVFDNREATVFLGDVAWPRDQFEVVYKGIVTTLQIKDASTFTLPITDNLQRLNGAINEELDSDDDVLPISLGEVSNVKPKLVDPVHLIYQVHTREIGGIIEVRDRALPINFAEDVEAGTFQLGAKPFGDVTCSVWGDAEGGYADTLATLIKRLATEFGPEPLQPSEVDEDNLQSFEAANPQCVGIYLDERANLLNVMSELAFSVGAGVCTSATGQLRLVQVVDPETKAAVFDITPLNIHADSFTVHRKLDVITAFKLAYNRNYGVGSVISAGLPSEHQTWFEEEWRYVKVDDPTLLARYRHTREPQPEISHLQVRSEALAECQRWLDIFKVQRYVYKLEGFEELLQLELGDIVSLEHPKFGFTPARNAMVIGLGKNWLTGQVNVELFA